MMPLAKLATILATCATVLFLSLIVPTAFAQGASTALPSARPSASEALEEALFGLLDAERNRGFETTVSVGEAVMSGDTVTATIEVEVQRNTEFVNEVALTLLPFQSVCDSTNCMAVRIFGSGEVYGRAGFVDILLPTAERGRERSLYWHALFRPLSVVVELVDPDGRVLRRASQQLRGGDYTLPLGVNPAGAANGLPARLSSDVYGPIAVTMQMEGIPEAIWQAAASVSVTVIPVVVEPQNPEEYLSPLVEVAIGMYVSPEDAAELFIVPGVLIVEAFSNAQVVQGPADPDATWDATTVRRLESARVVTHVDGVPVESIEQLADLVFEYREVQATLTVWDQATATSEVVECRLPALTRNSRTLVPVVYPVYESLGFAGRPLGPDRFGVFTRAANLESLILWGDCLDWN